ARVIDLDPGHSGRVFEHTVAGQAPSVHSYIDLANPWIEGAERHVGDHVVRAGAGKWFLEKIGMTVDSRVSRLEDHQASMKPGGVVVVGRVDVSDVIRGEIQTGQMEWRIHRVLNIDDVAIIDRDAIDFERVSGFERILPSFLPQWDLAFLFRH